MFVQIPQIVNDADIVILVDQVVARERLSVLLAPYVQVIFQTCDVVE